MRVLHVVASLAREWGGPPQVVTQLTQALAREGVQCTVYAPDFPPGGHPVGPQGADVKVFPADGLARFWTAHSASLSGALAQDVRSFDLLHIHELWHHPHFAAARAALKAKVPYIVSVHGQLEPWALHHDWWKKRPYMGLVQRRTLLRAAAIHAITDVEALRVRRIGFRGRVAVVPNGIDPAEFESLPAGEIFDTQYPTLREKRVVLFMGRLHPQKGLDVLAAAFAQMAKGRDDVRLVIAGPDADGHGAQIRRYLREAKALDKTVFTGMLDKTARLAALSRADLYVQPSRSEGGSLALLEALAAARPVIVSPECQFPEVAHAQAGLVVERDPQRLADAMTRLLEDPQALEQMGQRGRALVMERYTWPSVAHQMRDLYQGVLADASRSP